LIGKIVEFIYEIKEDETKKFVLKD